MSIFFSVCTDKYVVTFTMEIVFEQEML